MRKAIVTLFNRLMLGTNDWMFLTLCNFKNRLQNRRLDVVRDAGTYRISDEEGKSLAFTEKARVWHFRNGVENTIAALKEAYFLDQIELCKGDCVIDCGANIGEFYFALPDGIVYTGFEPSPAEFRALRKNVSAGTVENCGLWHTTGRVSFYLSSEGADSSCIDMGESTAAIEVPVYALDDYMSGPLKLLKVEAEGAEPEVLRGAQKTLTRTEFVVVDMGPERGREKANTVAQVVDYMYANNFFLVAYGMPRVVGLFQNRNR